jgi:hypothetical protein
VVGATPKVPPSEDPQTPFTGSGVLLALQLSVVPPLDPWQVQYQGPVPETAVAVPVEHRFVVGAVLNVPPSEEPQVPFTGSGNLLAKQEEVVPPFNPAQVHLQIPFKVTLEGVPELHKPVVGAVWYEPPLEDPHCPLIGSGALFALQLAVVPPLEPVQDQYQGPAPVTEVATPDEQRLVVGAVLNVPPLEDPHCPLIGSGALFALQLAVVPPLEPVQDQYQGPAPVTEVATPDEQRLVVGAVLNVPPLEDPQTPFTGLGNLLAKQEEVLPPFNPAQVHLQVVPSKVTPEGVPELHSPEVGAVWYEPPLEDPHCPLIGSGALFALQLAVVPPLEPVQDQYQGPAPVTEVATPDEQRLVVGAVLNVPPLEDPQTPFTGGFFFLIVNLDITQPGHPP